MITLQTKYIHTLQTNCNHTLQTNTFAHCKQNKSAHCKQKLLHTATKHRAHCYALPTKNITHCKQKTLHAANKRKSCARAGRCEELVHNLVPRGPFVPAFLGANFDIINMASSESDFSDAEADNGEEIAQEGLPCGSERDIIEYYFNRGLTYRHITLMLARHHRIDINERSLKRRLKDYRA